MEIKLTGDIESYQSLSGGDTCASDEMRMSEITICIEIKPLPHLPNHESFLVELPVQKM